MSAQTTIPARPHGPWHTAWPQSAARLAAAVLLIALLFGSAWTALYPLGLWDREALPLFIAEPAVGQFEFLWASTGGPESLVHPYGVAVDADGNVWVSDGKNDRFQIFAPDGTFLEAWGSSGSSDGQFDFHATYGNPSYDYGDVAFDADGNIYVADTGNFRVQKFAPDRSFLQAWGSEGRGDGQLLAPGGIAIGPSGTVFVADEGRSDVPMFTADGTFLGTIGRPGSGDGEFLTPAGVAVDSGGDVWVADFSLNRIQRFSASGEFIAAWGETGEKDGQLHGPNDVVVDRFGHVFVAETHNNRLQVLSEDGRFLATIGEFGTEEPGQFYNSLGVAIDADGVIYVSDNRRLQAFRLILPQGATLVVDQTTLSN